MRLQVHVPAFFVYRATEVLRLPLARPVLGMQKPASRVVRNISERGTDNVAVIALPAVFS